MKQNGGVLFIKRVYPALFVLMAGCIVQSFHPFYLDKSKVTLAQLDGEWDAVTAWGDKMDGSNVPPWRIAGDQILTPEPAKIHVTFFKAGGQLFCDSIAGDLDGSNKVSWYWAWHARPIHTVTKVETNGDLLTFKPLDLDWLTGLIAAGKVSLPHLTRTEDKDWPLFTAKPADWEKLLTKYANNTDAFPTNHIYVFKRHITTPVK